MCIDFWAFILEKTAEVPETVMQEIAVNILSYFSTVDSLTSSEQLIARIPTLSSCIKPRYIKMHHPIYISYYFNQLNTFFVETQPTSLKMCS
jgi:Neurochondrin